MEFLIRRHHDKGLPLKSLAHRSSAAGSSYVYCFVDLARQSLGEAKRGLQFPDQSPRVNH
jgi:hypothetical protein